MIQVACTAQAKNENDIKRYFLKECSQPKTQKGGSLHSGKIKASLFPKSRALLAVTQSFFFFNK
jgi:hypothetical protein